VQHLEGKVAVVTGAASGIGLALARRFGQERMRVVLADVDGTGIDAAAADLRGAGIDVLAVATDVSRAEDVATLAARTLDAFGAVHVVCNNAGVFAGGLTWEAPAEDYAWVLGVNVWGVVHGIRTFTPILLQQDDEGHIVNTASMAAVTTLPYAGIYHMSKHAVLALSESLYHELRLRGARIGVSALCPEAVATRIGDSERNRPERFLARAAGPPSPERELVDEALRQNTRTGTAPAEIAGRVLDAIRTDRFYVLSEDAWRATAETRMEDIRLARNPTFAPPV
jgi:NAD(P)-dependent dehydrogenase (short-subunit alcohol dehydrogenase family)